MPAAQRDRMIQVYLQSYDTWRQLERKLGLPADDVAAQWPIVFADRVESVGEEFPEEVLAK